MTPQPTLPELFSLFPSHAPPRFESIPSGQMPEPYRTLLVHDNHMTVTVEDYYREPVTVQVLEVVRDGPIYSRKILLSNSKCVVQFGIVEIDFETLPLKVQVEILAGDTPLGRVLIQNDVLTRVVATGFLRVTADEQFASWFQIPVGTTLFGRLGVIYAGEKPAIEVLEILAPVPIG